MSTRLVIEDVWKSYPRWTGERTLKHAVRHRLPALLRPAEARWALQGVSLRLGSASGVGIIGTNGAGKSTLLKLAAGLARPTRGQLLIPDRVATVLSLGDVFDFALTGADNAVTTAVAAGMSLRQAHDALPGILAFAELESFADAPVRTYSDGMRLRLAFGVVAQLRPDLILLDEVIAVGDMRFQRRCMDWVRERRDEGAGLLFASHSLEQVAQECDQVVWLEGGRVRSSGPAAEVIDAYREAMSSETRRRTPAPDPGDRGPLELRRNRLGSQEATIRQVRLLGRRGQEIDELHIGAPLEVELLLDAPDSAGIDEPIVSVSVARADDGTVVYDTSTAAENVPLGVLRDGRRVALSFPHLDLLPGEYTISVGLYEGTWAYAYDYHWQAYTFRVSGDTSDSGIFRPPHAWRT